MATVISFTALCKPAAQRNTSKCSLVVKGVYFTGMHCGLQVVCHLPGGVESRGTCALSGGVSQASFLLPKQD